MYSSQKVPKRGFSQTEFEQRLDRAQRHLVMFQLDAIVVTTPANVRYFTGFDTQFWESPTRPWFVVVPQTGEPVAVIPEIGAPEMALTWIKNIRTWPAPRPSDDGTTLLADTLSTLPRKFGRIGFELGREHSLRMPVTQFMELRERLLGVELTNGSLCIWEIRMVKTSAEVDHIRHVCQIVSAAYRAVPTLLSIGQTERDACRRLRIDIAERGADSTPFLPCVSGPGGVPQIVCGPHDRTLQRGDILFIDTGSTYDGYYCDFDRNYAIGNVSDEAKRAHEILWQATEAGIMAAVIGATSEDLFRAMARFVEANGCLGNVGRFGHGLGMQLTEPPSHMIGDETVIQEGMVLTIEPGMEYAPGKILVHEENIVVTANGPLLLTDRAPRELPVIS
jgi:Xaa-Pro aminopeptidase